MKLAEGQGDTVAVVPTSFAVQWISCQRCLGGKTGIVDLIKYGSSLILILLILIFVARPIIRVNMPDDDGLDIPLPR